MHRFAVLLLASVPALAATPRALYVHGGGFPNSLGAGLVVGSDRVRLDLELVRKRELLLFRDFPETRTSVALLTSLPLADVNALSLGGGWAEGVRRGRVTGSTECSFLCFGDGTIHERIVYREPVLCLRATAGFGWTDLGFGLGTRLGLDLGPSGSAWLLQLETSFGRLGRGLLTRP